MEWRSPAETALLSPAEAGCKLVGLDPVRLRLFHAAKIFIFKTYLQLQRVAVFFRNCRSVVSPSRDGVLAAGYIQD